MLFAEEQDNQISELAGQIGQLALADGITVAVAESLTAGRIAQVLGAAAESSSWFAGGVVAYQNETKYRLLGVSRGPVVTAECSEQMARAVLDTVGADVSVSVTGVGGPGPEEGERPGTVFISVSSRCAVRTVRSQFSGSPSEVVGLTTLHALRNLKKLLLDS
ncbi:CinA family protein [Cryobacterium adonitolivorans]|uniref:CinA family protein n=1 Tax=Cryobacterium adonitolivorans TaxID=1259189 RepID=A0A4R8W7X7_9MICO|nr:CinA family protein [Cryobacterium adonitolivorans]TFC04384.1 CinA family protein [Cryobacterium adonitolivorans]